MKIFTTNVLVTEKYVPFKFRKSSGYGHRTRSRFALAEVCVLRVRVRVLLLELLLLGKMHWYRLFTAIRPIHDGKTGKGSWENSVTTHWYTGLFCLSAQQCLFPALFEAGQKGNRLHHRTALDSRLRILATSIAYYFYYHCAVVVTLPLLIRGLLHWREVYDSFETVF